MLRNLWRLFWGNEWPKKPSLPAPDADKVIACDLCADPSLFARCLTHNLDLCWQCTLNHAKNGCVLEGAMSDAEMRAYGIR